jgi:hypothetical protein
VLRKVLREAITTTHERFRRQFAEELSRTVVSYSKVSFDAITSTPVS